MSRVNPNSRPIDGSSTPDSSNPSIRSVARDLPPQRQKKALRTDVSLPLENTSLRKLIYILIILTTALSAFYSYRLVQHKAAVGGWWNVAMGKKPPQMQTDKTPPVYSPTGSGSSHNLEGKITDLARSFGIPPTELASAIAVAVRNYVPPASLSSIAAKETGEIIKVLLEGDEEKEAVMGQVTATGAGSAEAPVATGVVEGFMDSFVGMEEP
ncbi:hypothetical protein BKA70DRAFT_1299220 [Coprinopsis sp. MPI-PUGE-AT-0042]|nr:hypothetical protein BKA70DRAFT_1299220 [Coprinopsis sp. MPI-PUGE-AT-0042]